MKITSKAEFFSLWRAGFLGNRTQLWTDPSEALASGALFIGFREIRAAGTAGSGAWILVSRDDVQRTYDQWKALGRNFMMDDGAPDDRVTLQGEVCRTWRGLEGLLGVKTGMNMRQAMREGRLLPASYSQVRDALYRYMDPTSHSDVDALFELFPDATIEFSCYDCNVGNLPGRNTLVWEVRDY